MSASFRHFALCALLAAPASAQTCFRACLAPRIAAGDIADQQIRSQMRTCRNLCEAQALSAPGLAEKLEASEPQAVSDADMKRVRAASPGIAAYADAFTWDVRNVLDNRVIRRVEIATQNLELQEVVLAGAGTVLPGATETVLVAAFSGGYPSVAAAARVRAIYACPLP